MDDSTLSHLRARDRSRAAGAVEAALLAVSRSIREGLDDSERNLDHRLRSGSETHHVRLFLRAERMTLKHRSTIDGVDRRTTVTASAAASPPALPKTVGEAYGPLER